jgi:Tfp pilus assembly PilM family ATPase
MLKLAGVRPPRRVLAIDAGSRCLKLLLAESEFGRARILKEELIDLSAEGLVSADETKTELQTVLDDWGRPPVALVLPQHSATSQVIDLPVAPESEVRKLIEGEAVKMSGVSESHIVYDFVRTEGLAGDRQHFWVTLCQENDIRERITRLGVEHEDLCEVTTAANALIAAFRAARPDASRSILVHMGAQTTVVAILLGGQGVFASGFQMGGDFFTRAVARLAGCPEEAAETMKRTRNLFTGPDARPDFPEVVDGWVAEFKRQLNEWFERNPAFLPEVQTFEIVASGGAFELPGLLDYLEKESGLAVRSWPRDGAPDTAIPSIGFEVAHGTALQALGFSPQPVSLLPEDYRAAWRKQTARRRLEMAATAMIVLCALVLAAGTWSKISLIDRKETLLAKTQAASETVEANALFTGEFLADYESLRPVFQAQQNTLDTLRALALLQQTRTNRQLWCVLLADQQSYFTLPLDALGNTNKPAGTNQAAAPLLERTLPLYGPFLPGQSGYTNPPPAKPGLIAEVCVPADAEAARGVLSQVVNELKQQHLFSKVDLLSEDLRRTLADPKLIIPDRHYALALDFAATEYQQPVPPRKLPQRGPKRPPRSPAGVESSSRNAPGPS